ncbi:MAG: Sensory transduction histidine kinase, partial [Myxococcaceae bacterium]|nr:Sensory transduction histidine kinase [Myxococcaceae bacterium]
MLAVVTGGSQDKANKRERLASLRRQIRDLEAEVGAVADVETSSASTDPRTLTARERQLTEAERIAQVGSWALHVTSNSVHWSDELFRITGVDPDNHGDLVEAFFARIHPEDRPGILAEHAQMLTRGGFSPGEFRIVRPDGTERRVRG